MFDINQRVMCINGDFSQLPAGFNRYFSAFPVKGQVYTVRDILPGIGGEVACHLHEIRNLINPKGTENGYNVERFAPVEDMPFAVSFEESTSNTMTP